MSCAPDPHPQRTGACHERLRPGPAPPAGAHQLRLRARRGGDRELLRGVPARGVAPRRLRPAPPRGERSLRAGPLPGPPGRRPDGARTPHLPGRAEGRSPARSYHHHTGLRLLRLPGLRDRRFLVDLGRCGRQSDPPGGVQRVPGGHADPRPDGRFGRRRRNQAMALRRDTTLAGGSDRPGMASLEAAPSGMAATVARAAFERRAASIAERTGGRERAGCSDRAQRRQDHGRPKTDIQFR